MQLFRKLSHEVPEGQPVDDSCPIIGPLGILPVPKGDLHIGKTASIRGKIDPPSNARRAIRQAADAAIAAQYWSQVFQ